MTSDFPTAVALFFSISNSGDTRELRACFAENAVVVDEKQTYAGIAAIEAWLAEVKKKYAYQATPLSWTRKHDSLTVDVRVEGRFPGSPARIEHVFRLAGERIEHLDIH